jgi:hypothetical protein
MLYASWSVTCRRPAPSSGPPRCFTGGPAHGRRHLGRPLGEPARPGRRVVTIVAGLALPGPDQWRARGRAPGGDDVATFATGRAPRRAPLPGVSPRRAGRSETRAGTAGSARARPLARGCRDRSTRGTWQGSSTRSRAGSCPGDPRSACGNGAATVASVAARARTRNAGARGSGRPPAGSDRSRATIARPRRARRWSARSPRRRPRPGAWTRHNRTDVQHPAPRLVVAAEVARPAEFVAVDAIRARLGATVALAGTAVLDRAVDDPPGVVEPPLFVIARHRPECGASRAATTRGARAVARRGRLRAGWS